MQTGIVKEDGRGGHLFVFLTEPQGDLTWENTVPVHRSQQAKAHEMVGLTVKAIIEEGQAHIKQIVT